jgi:predicted restriction endonuclease
MSTRLLHSPLLLGSSGERLEATANVMARGTYSPKKLDTLLGMNTTFGVSRVRYRVVA